MIEIPRLDTKEIAASTRSAVPLGVRRRWITRAGYGGAVLRALVLLTIGAVAVFAALRWVSFERYLE